MKPLDLYKFITQNEIESRKTFNDTTGKNDILVWIPYNCLQKFIKMLGYNFTAEKSFFCHFTDNRVTFWMNEILDYFEINAEDIFEE